MAYQVPKQWQYGDTISAVDMQKYSDSLNYLNGIIPSGGKNFATPFSQFSDAQEFWVVHSKQFLVYKSTGQIQDPAGVEEAVSLSDDAEFNSYDIDTIPWLTYGDLYKVVGCSVCMEDWLGV